MPRAESDTDTPRTVAEVVRKDRPTVEGTPTRTLKNRTALFRSSDCKTKKLQLLIKRVTRNIKLGEKNELLIEIEKKSIDQTFDRVEED